MEVRAPEAGLQISRDTALVLTANQVLVTQHGARPITVKFLIDSQRLNGVDGHYEAEYELKNGSYLGLYFKQVKDDIMIRVRRGKSQLSYSVRIDRFVDEDLMPVSMSEFEDLVHHWLND